MDVSLNLLNKYVKVDDIAPEELAAKITSVGLEVEGMHKLCKGTDLVVGEVLTCVPHPNSDHMSCTTVNVGDEVLNIVCGAPNVAAGQKVIVAKPGCDFGDGFVIKKSKLRGEESNGMICALFELGIDKRFLAQSQIDGIEILPDDAPVGHEALSYLGLDDTILEIGLTPNRSDCMAMTSLAYEVGAILNREVKIPEVSYGDELDSEIEVAIETEKCPFFGAKLVKNVTTKRSPEWLRNALMASGIKPINNVVDISNYVMVETGQPIHMYDYDKLAKKAFTVKTGFDCKEVMLDGEEYQLEPNDVIVSTDGGVGCIAGVMGANSTKIDDATTNIVIEAATFDGASLRNTARRLNLLTDASQHYIKAALNTKNTLYVLQRCANLLADLADAKEVYKTVNTPLDTTPLVVDCTTTNVNGLLGTSITTEEIGNIFSSLKFAYTLDGDRFSVTVPTYRNDITIEADLIEEVARMYSYDKIPSTLPEMAGTKGVYTPSQAKEKQLKHVLAHAGLHETLTYTLTSPSNVDDFNYFHTNETIKLDFPLGEERSVVRKSLIPSLLQAIYYNQSHGNKDVCLFETSKTYSVGTELNVLAIAATGNYHATDFKGVRSTVDYYVVKGLVENIFAVLGVDEARVTLERVSKDSKDYHPGRTALVYVDHKLVGVIGNIHPLMEKKYSVKNVYTAELNLTALFAIKTGKVKFEDIPVYPSVSRDIALVMDEDVLTVDVIRKIKKSSNRLVKEAKVFDVYVGEHVEDGKKSVAISLTFQDPKKTLDDAAIQEAMDKILKAVEKEFGATLRA